ncbi:TerC family protein [Cellvibrio polysaccharolyticus]|uniref:TerC family protein n=1 Tax=Cellvibrio polysaccharolyticus TaxID=2082724 RepID=A0A928V4S1_9GAMM|nr:TerC family protein [Cellvibrio polysaccharolyticus]MBE8718237.1 TerC family protein [Cellvibrio polysaccharolyticus]
MEFLMDPSIWAGLLALIVLEIVLGIDNLVFIAILADKLPPHQRDKARVIGLSLALIMRLGLLSVISWMVTLTNPLFYVAGWPVSGRDMILLFGGLFLVYKATVELHEKMEGKNHVENKSTLYAGFWVVVTQIVILDAVFSLDAVITAVGMVDNIYVMMTAVVIAMTVMLLASKPLTIFVNKHPTVVILCLSFLLMIGFSLIAESFGLHIPKGYLYAAIGFSILIEVFNQLSKHNSLKNQEKQPFRERTADAIIKLISRNPLTVSPSQQVQVEQEKIFADEERYMISGVLTLSERSVKGIMTPRSDISWLDINDSQEKLRETILSVPHSFFPVARENIDNVFAMVRAKEFLDALDNETDLKPLMSKYRPVYISDHMNILQVMKVLRQSNGSPAMVVDEFGSIKGLITPLDIFEAIAGEFPDADETPEIQKMPDGTWLVSGAADLYQLELELDVNHLISRKDGSFISVAGLILEELGHIPSIDEKIVRENLMFTVREIQENRIHLVEVSIVEPENGHE